ncbi:MAG: aspartate kinase [Rickettsiales bacterium]|nr:aspartate kinase [Rickettsiales bacterium]
MTIVVHKYGGSSVATPEKLGSIADRVVDARRNGTSPVVVVSAMGGTTDKLLSLAQEVSPNTHRRELDMILTAGERISMALLAMAINDRGFQALSLTGSQAGIITTTDHNRARIIEVRPVRVHQALQAGQIVIVGGFAGVSTDKEVTTLGRGGSDTTAIALAAALDAASCDIFSDVDGVFSADPRVVSDAARIDRLASGEALEMGLRGARVLAPEAVDYARRHGVQLHARSSFETGPGTVITEAPSPGTGRAVAIAADPGVVPIKLSGPTDILLSLLDQLNAGVLVCRDLLLDCGTDKASAELRIDTRNTQDWQSVIAELSQQANRLGAHLQSFAELGTVTVIGEGIAEQASSWQIARSELQKLQLTPRRLSSNAWGISAEVPVARLDELTRAWHTAFPGLSSPPGEGLIDD